MSTNRPPTAISSARLASLSLSARPQGVRTVKWYVCLAGFALAFLGVVVVCAPTYPAEEQYLVAAAQMRDNLRYDLALARYAAASRLAPGDPKPFCLEGQVLGLQQEWQEAAAAYAHCASLDAAAAGTWLALGNARSQLGDETGALAAWKRSSELGDVAAVEQLALAAEEQGNVTGAIALWRQIPTSNREAAAHLGMLALWQGDWASAQRYLELAKQSGSSSWLLSDGFDTVLTLPPNSFQSEGQLGHAFLSANLPRLALAPWQRAVALSPRNGEARAYLGETWLLLGEPALASPEIASGLKLAPSTSFVWFAAGELAMAQAQPSLGLRDFQQGASLDPANPLFWEEASRASLELRDYYGAEQMMQTASGLTNNPDEAIALLSIYVDYHLGFLDGTARRAGIAAVTRWPGNETLEFLLAEIFTGTNEAANAYYTAEAARSLDPTDPGPYVLLGAQAENEGNYVTAALMLRIALALRPSGPYAREAEALLAPIQDISP